LKAKPLPDDPETMIEGEDYYMDGPYLVFTEAYHLKRGYCCNSGCRHCPWRASAHDAVDDEPIKT
jgi:hypothetical protein